MQRTLTTIFAVLLLVPGTGLAADHASRAWDGTGISLAGGGPFPPTLDEIQVNVFTPSCAQSFCHGEALSANLDLRPGASFSNLVNVPSVEIDGLRVVPFEPDASYLICKLENCPEIVGSQMPVIGGPLDQSVIDVIREWIANGATKTPISVSPTTWSQVKALYR